MSIDRRKDDHDQPLQVRRRKQDTDADDLGTRNEYVVDKSFAHSVENSRGIYRAWRNRYSPTDHTDESEENLSGHFICR